MNVTNLFELIPHINTSENAIQFLRDREILRSEPPICTHPQCMREMTEVSMGRRRRSGGDDKIWRCPTHKSKKLSIRHGSFLDGSHLTPKKFVLFAYLWAHGAPHHLQTSLCDMDEHTVVNWNNFLREICALHLLNNPIELGGPGRVVQIDESLMSKRKYHVGHQVPERWVFGMYDVHQKLGVLQFVDNRTQATLFPIIQKFIAPGTMIHSDRFSAYVNNNAGVDPPPSHLIHIPVNSPYQHHSVNHTFNFVDPITEAHTNHVEGFWNNAKRKNKQMSGTTAELLPSYLDEFMWRQQYGKKTVEAFNNILEQISNYYPVNI